jgi:hypothetical protein
MLQRHALTDISLDYATVKRGVSNADRADK